MSDFDPCECVWNHEHAMRRLINMLRQSQDSCTDNDCQVSPLTPQGNDTSTDGMGSMFFFIVMLWFVIAAALFMTRPSSLRGQPNKKDRPSAGGSSGRSSGPPPPPVPPVS